MHVFVINLDRDQARLDWMRQKLDGLNMPWERFAAFDRPRVAAFRATSRWPLFESGCTSNELGCSLSHYHIWREIVARDLPCALLLEDDVHFSASAADVIRAIDRKPVDFDVVKLETLYAGIETDRAAIDLIPGFRLFRLRSLHGGSAAYVISREGARKMIARFEIATRAIDLELFASDDESFVIYQAHPAPFVQDANLEGEKRGFGTSIGPLRQASSQAARFPFLRNALRKPYHALYGLMNWRRGRMKFKSSFRSE